MVELLTTMLELEGCQVTTFLGDQEAALDAVRREKPDVLLMDLFLGDCDGLKLIDQVRKLPGGGQVRIIVVSGSERSAECLEIGADAFLEKPFMPEELYAALHA